MEIIETPHKIMLEQQGVKILFGEVDGRGDKLPSLHGKDDAGYDKEGGYAKQVRAVTGGRNVFPGVARVI